MTCLISHPWLLFASNKPWNGKDWNKIGCNDTKFCVVISAEIITGFAVVLLWSTFCMCVVCVWKKDAETSLMHTVHACVRVCVCWCRCAVCTLPWQFASFSRWVCQADKHCWSSVGSLFNRLPPIENILPNICLQTDFNKCVRLLRSHCVCMCVC